MCVDGYGIQKGPGVPGVEETEPRVGFSVVIWWMRRRMKKWMRQGTVLGRFLRVFSAL